jgi:hypothetical protein
MYSDAVIKKKGRGINCDDLGEVQSIGSNYVTSVAQKDILYSETLVEVFNGHNLWVRISKKDGNKTFAREIF